MALSEAQVRDAVAERLNQIDPFLRLVGKEHPVRLVDGTKGLIDILAKDDFGCYTIIEIKKSKQTSRSAVQQLYKYASFIKSARRLEVRQIRCVIVSTVWENDLLAPFGEFKHFSEYESKGYLVSFNMQDEIEFEEVNAVFEPGNTEPLPRFIFFEFKELALRDEFLKILGTVLDLIPSLNCVITDVNYLGDENAVVNPFGFAWTIFTGNFYETVHEMSAAKASLRSPDTWFDTDLETILSETEYPEELICGLILREFIEIPRNKGEYAYFALHSFGNILAAWQILSLRGRGPMFADGFFDSDEVKALAGGFLGGHPYYFSGRMSPSRPPHFAMMRERVSNFLRFNSEWRHATNFILSSLEESDVVEVEIYNPLNFFGFLNDLYRDGKSVRIPRLNFLCKHSDGRTTRYFGALVWSPRCEPETVAKGIAESYPNEHYFQFRAVNQRLNHYDEKLSDLYGLSYGLLRISENSLEALQLEDWEPVWKKCPSILTLDDFVQKHGKLIEDVGEYFATFLH